MQVSLSFPRRGLGLQSSLEAVEEEEEEEDGVEGKGKRGVRKYPVCPPPSTGCLTGSGQDSGS